MVIKGQISSTCREALVGCGLRRSIRRGIYGKGRHAARTVHPIGERVSSFAFSRHSAPPFATI
jgi:hypothetical protein